jgi:hypothetical protein
MAYAIPENLPLQDMHPDLRRMIIDSVEGYNPRREVNVWFRLAEGSLGSFIGRVGQAGLMVPTPEEYYKGKLSGLGPAEYYEANRERIETDMKRKMRGD